MTAHHPTSELGEPTLCQHHALVLRSVRNLTHADDDIRAQIAADLARQCPECRRGKR